MPGIAWFTRYANQNLLLLSSPLASGRKTASIKYLKRGDRFQIFSRRIAFESFGQKWLNYAELKTDLDISEKQVFVLGELPF